MDKERSKQIIEWKKKSVYQVMIQLNNEKDKELIDIIKSQNNKNAFIKEALLEYIKK